MTRSNRSALARVSVFPFMLSFAAALSSAAAASVPEGFVLWNAQRAQEVADALEKRVGDKSIVYETMGTYKGHSIYLVLRRKTGAAELHETESDLQIGVRGKATFVVGGELVNPQRLPRKQVHGSSIKDGTSYPLAPGDLIHVPPGIPHQIIVEPDQPYIYILVKLDEEPLSGDQPRGAGRPSSSREGRPHSDTH